MAVLFRILRNHGVEFEFANLKLSKNAEKLQLDTVASKTDEGKDETNDDLVDIKKGAEGGTGGGPGEISAAISPKIVEELMKVNIS